jgi:hypothetical protein
VTSKQPASLAEARAVYRADEAAMREFFEQLAALYGQAVAGVAEIAREIAQLTQTGEQQHRSHAVNADVINRAAGKRVEPVPRHLDAFLAALDPQTAAVYEAARHGAPQAAQALAETVKE